MAGLRRAYGFRISSNSMKPWVAWTEAAVSSWMMSFKFSQLAFSFCEKPQISTFIHARNTPRITCGLRNGPRKPLWRKRVLSTEAIQAVQCLKLAQNSSKLEHVFSTKVSRLLKDDLLDTLAELQRQNELDLALKVLFINFWSFFRISWILDGLVCR